MSITKSFWVGEKNNINKSFWTGKKEERKTQETTKTNISIADVPKININSMAEQSRGGMTSAQIRQQTNLMQQQKALEKQQEQERWNNLSLGEKIADPFKTAGANIKFGDLGIEENIAWNEYRDKQDEESLKKAQEATRAREEYQLNNDRIGKGNAVTKDFAQYLPQLGGQLKSGIGGAAGGAGAGALGGAGVAFAAGQLGPQVVVPEEIATVPAGALTGAIWGGKTGYVAGTAKYGYDMMAGSAYKTLLDMGVPNDVALELSGDEALISSLIEGGGAIVDLITLGIGKLGSKGATTAGKELAKNRLLAAAKAYGVNLISEPIEEMAQEKVSIETEKKAADVSGIERTATDSEDWQRIKDAGETALKVAAVSGGLNAGGNYLTNTISENLTTNRDTLKLSPLDEATQNQLANINKNIEYQKQNESLANKQIQESVQNAKNNIENSKTTLALPEGNRFYADEKGNVVTAQNYVAPRGQVQNQNSPVNTKQAIVDAQNNSQNDLLRQINTTLPTQVEMAQKTNTEQINATPNLPTQKARKTYQSAKIAGMTDVDMKKAIDLNNMLRSGANLEFYDPKNIPQGVDTLRAADANGFYMNGTLWINKNSEMKVEKILGHELTHYVENDDLVNTILDSNIFYDFLAEKGFNNTAEFKTYLMEKKGYKQNELNSEMVAHFAEEKLFGKEETINRLARENRTLAQKILNWISDLRTKIAGSTEAKELLKIENMYRKALEQARNTTTSAEAQYSIAGVKAMENINDAELTNAYNEAQRTGRNTRGWFKDKEGNWKFEFSDKDMTLKKNLKLSDTGNRLGDILEHDALFRAYPELRDTIVNFKDLKKGSGLFDKRDGEITLNKKLFNTQDWKTKVEASLIHEIQHAIQEIEGYPGAANPFWSKKAYYEALGEIEASDTKERFLKEKDGKLNRSEIKPRSSEPNPKHRMYDEYMSKRGIVDKVKDAAFPYYAGKGGKGYEILEEAMVEDNKANLRMDDGRGLRRYVDDTAGKEPAFSMPETDNQGRKLSKEQQEFFKDSKVRDENGKLLEVYHGTSSGGFTIFDSNKLSKETRTSQYGKGFYFTDRQNLAKAYMEGENSQLYAVYLDIKKPFLISWLNDKSHNLDRNSLKRILLEGNSESFFNKWIADSQSNIEELGSLTKEDISKMSREEKVELFLQGEYDRYSDQNILKELVRAFNTNGELIDSMQRNLGYDGIIVEDKLRGNQYIAFNSNQIKNVDNTNPTENPDIRYSVNPVNIAKNPPNIETGLDQLNRTKRVKEGDSQSNFASNILNQSIFDEKFTNLALDDKNIRLYESISNKETLQEANDAINEQGQKWVDRFLDKPDGEMKATDIAGGFILMNRYQQVGDYESMIRVAEKLRKAGTQQGQTIQMFSVLGRMTPEGMTYYAQKELSKAYEEILKNKTQKWADEHADEFKLNNKDIEYIQRRVTQAAKLPEGRDKYVLLGEIASRIQNKIPPQAGQGLKALARNSMLLNPKTMVRNILGNVVIVPNHIVSDFVGAGIDKAISKKTGVRTTGGFDVKALQGAKKGFYESFDDFRRKISTREMGGDRFEIGQGKNFYENHTGRFGETRNKINKALNGLDRVTGFLLETGDRPFYETWFINSLNNQMKLNNVTEPTAEMIEIATDEALQRTWQDNNTYTRGISGIRKFVNLVNIKGYGLGDMVMPFVKTPANLTKAVVDFSPLGAINAAVKTSQFNKDIGKGTATAKQQREVVKAWSQVITGTLGMAIMAALANAGMITGGSDEDKDVRAFEQNILGIKPYSIKIGDKSYTYDWAQPLGTSAAMVADTVKSLKNADDTEGKVAAILNGLESGASVLLDQALVSGIRNLFEEDNLINGLLEIALNEPAKFAPQSLSQLAQIQDDTARTSYVYNNPIQTAKNKIKAKIPGLRETLEPSVDVLGREVKTDNSIGNVMFNPSNTAFARTTEGAEEMYRVYQATGDKATIAQVAPYYFNVGSEKIVLTPKQRTQYQKTIGKIASDGVESLLKNKAYEQLEDTDKAEILKDLYSYGTAIAKAEASTSYLLPNDMKKIKDSGMKPEEYILLKYISNLGGTKKDEQYNSLTYAGYTQKETEEFLTDYKGYKFDNTSKNTLPALKQQRAKLPTLKK